MAVSGLTGLCGILLFFTIGDATAFLGFKAFLIIGTKDFLVLFIGLLVSALIPMPLTIFCAEASCLTTAASLPLAKESPDPDPDSDPEPSSGRYKLLVAEDDLLAAASVD